jgi:hypothetical protein
MIKFITHDLDTIEVLNELYEHLCREVFPNMHSNDVKKVINAIEKYGRQTNPEYNVGE